MLSFEVLGSCQQTELILDLFSHPHQSEINTVAGVILSCLPIMLFSDQPNKRFSQMVPPPEFPFLKFWLQTTQKFQLTVKLLQGPDQVLGTCSGSIGEQNLTRLSMLILRQTLFLVMRNGFPPIGY